jgi:hypothetical protein
MLDVRIATTPEEREAIQRFRYAIYVEELGRYGNGADHEHRLLGEPEDDRSWLFYAMDGDQIVASTRISWGGDGFSDRQIAQYRLEPFLAELPHDVLAVGERMMIAPDRRGADVFVEMAATMQPTQDAHGVKVVFGACEPHLLSMYLAFQRPYADRNINTPEAGYLIPLVAFPDGPEALVGLGDGDGLPRCVRTVLDGTGAVRSRLLGDPHAYRADLEARLAALRPPVFDGLVPDELGQCIARSTVVRCAEGDRILKRGRAARNVFVVLEGSLEVSRDSHPAAVLLAGDVFGETAFLLHGTRTFDVDVLEDGTTLLVLSERTLRSLQDDEPVAAAKLFANISRILCQRLVTATSP